MKNLYCLYDPATNCLNYNWQEGEKAKHGQLNMHGTFVARSAKIQAQAVADICQSKFNSVPVQILIGDKNSRAFTVREHLVVEVTNG